MTQYQTINDSKYNFINEVALRNTIVKAGRRHVVFVEGYDDKVIFNILYEDEEMLEKVSFIDISLEKERRKYDHKVKHKGGCEGVKFILKHCVAKLPDEKRFYGVIDRDLNFDDEIELERNKTCYDGRLFIFFQRYTLENYFIDINVLEKFIEGQTINNRNLLELEGIEDIYNSVMSCMADIAAANLTIKEFNLQSTEKASFLATSVDCSKVNEQLCQRLPSYEKGNVINKFNNYKIFVSESNENIHKFTSAKTYFSHQFAKLISERCGGKKINLQENKDSLARILRDLGLPEEFEQLKEFVLG